MRSIRRTILSLVALIGLGAALGGCNHTQNMYGSAAVAGVAAGATNALVREAMVPDYQPAGYYGGGYASGLRPGMPCRYIDGRMGRLVFNPQSTAPTHLTCMCPPNGPMYGRPMYLPPRPMYRPPMYRPPMPMYGGAPGFGYRRW